MDRLDKAVLVIDEAAFAVAAACLIAPVAWHRALFRMHIKAEVVQAVNRLAVAGLAFLGVGLVLSMTLTVDLVTTRWISLVFGAGIAVLAVTLWLRQPIRHRRGPTD